jgi:pimeloyl-ACP methyl ester carboxylesterase
MKTYKIRMNFKASLFVGAFVLMSSCGSPGDRAKSEPKLILNPCSHEIDEQKELAEVGALCGRYEVWEDRETKKGRKIALNVAVSPALAKAKPDPVFLLAGGPGQAATEIPWMQMPWVKKLRLYRDIVLVDQRGTGASNPLDFIKPDEKIPFEELFKPNERDPEVEELIKGFDADLTKYTTDIAMDDLNEIRDALGYDKINIYGGSYGTRAALIYLRRHEDTVRSLVIDGVAPMEMKLVDAFAEDGERAIGLLLTHCENDEGCKKAFPNLRQKLNELILSLKEKPAQVQLKHPRTGELVNVTVQAETLGMTLFTSLYDTQRSALIPLAVESAHSGDFSVFGALLEYGSGGAEQISHGMQKAVLCNEDLALLDEGIEDTGPEQRVFSRHHMVSSFKEYCDFFQGAAKPASYFDSVTSEVPALVLSGELDPVTPPRWGEIASKNLKNSKHVVVPGMGHGVAVNGCVSNMVVDHIENASPAGIETECVKGIKRFPIFLTNTGPIATEKR